MMTTPLFAIRTSISDPQKYSIYTCLLSVFYLELLTSRSPQAPAF
jgi:hypothetical protein